MNEIFYKIIEFFDERIKTNDLKKLKLQEAPLEIKFLNFALELICDSKTPTFISYSLDVEYNRLIREHDITMETIEKLILIKYLTPAIQSLDFGLIQELCDFTCDGETRSSLYEKWDCFNTFFN